MRATLLRIVLPVICGTLLTAGSGRAEPLKVDFRYQPCDWRSMICMPADPIKTLVVEERRCCSTSDAIKLIPFRRRTPRG